MNDKTVVDANVIFSSLVSNSSKIWRGFSRQGVIFITPNFVIVELFKHFERIKKASQLPEDEILELLSKIVGKLKFYEEELISIGSWVEANRLCREVDEKDTPYLALALELNAKLWTNDKKLKEGLIKRGFNNFYEPFQ
ncbi:MAG: PIN domain-containing protein [Acidobacteriota bacterium]|jgi:predicted nucleic acid-binding protein|nr:PIN domain-containing protein [Acidobacteriota bacterium]